MEANKFYCKECGTEVEVESFEEILSRGKLCNDCNKPVLAKESSKRYCKSRQKRLNRTRAKRLQQSIEDYDKKYNRENTYGDSD